MSTNEEPEENPYSVQDFDIERSIFGLVVTLTKQKINSMGEKPGRLAVENFLSSLIDGLKMEDKETDDAIQDFMKQQRNQ